MTFSAVPAGENVHGIVVRAVTFQSSYDSVNKDIQSKSIGEKARGMEDEILK